MDLYDYVSPSGRSIRQAYDRLVPWVADPASFPYYRGRDRTQMVNVFAISYWEILDARWPHPDAQRLLAKRRPMSSPHSMPHMTFTHGDIPSDL